MILLYILFIINRLEEYRGLIASGEFRQTGKLRNNRLRLPPDSLSVAAFSKEWTDIAKDAEAFTVPVLCFRNKE